MATTRCSNGRVSITADVERQLFASSGGHCQKCRLSVFVDVGTRTVSVAEMAHIIGATDDGPRGESDLSPTDRAALSNLLLLCSSCHTVVDKAPKEFPVTLLNQWKTQHEQSIRDLFGVVSRETRRDARRDLVRPLAENRTIWETYGPESPGADEPLSEKVLIWRRKAAERILPNNRRALLVLDANRELLTDTERRVVEAFRQHADDLEARHIHGLNEANSIRFPVELEDVFT